MTSSRDTPKDLGNTLLDIKSLSDPEYRKLVEERRARLRAQIEKDEALYTEFLTDAKKYPNLTAWEIRFTNDLFLAFKRGICTRFDDLSDKQKASCDAIKRKLYNV
jgi:hypothetical protein